VDLEQYSMQWDKLSDVLSSLRHFCIYWNIHLKQTSLRVTKVINSEPISPPSKTGSGKQFKYKIFLSWSCLDRQVREGVKKTYAEAHENTKKNILMNWLTNQLTNLLQSEEPRWTKRTLSIFIILLTILQVRVSHSHTKQVLNKIELTNVMIILFHQYFMYRFYFWIQCPDQFNFYNVQL